MLPQNNHTDVHEKKNTRKRGGNRHADDLVAMTNVHEENNIHSHAQEHKRTHKKEKRTTGVTDHLVAQDVDTVCRLFAHCALSGLVPHELCLSAQLAQRGPPPRLHGRTRGENKEKEKRKRKEIAQTQSPSWDRVCS